MRAPAEYPEQWGRTKLLRLERDESGEWLGSDWYDIVDPPAAGQLSHGTGGCRPADTVLVVVADEVVALADAFSVEADNVYAFDTEYYLVLRVREVLDAGLWQTLPWRELGAGNVVHVWDKFHGIDWLRGQSPVDRVMTYGGDWPDLEELVNREHAPVRPPERSDTPGEATLLTAVRQGDVPRVRALLARGLAPRDLGVPDGVRCLELGFSHPRSSSPLVESLDCPSPELTQVLLEAGAPVDQRFEGGYTALHAALIGRRPEHVRVLLRFGADPELRCGGRTALELADGISPELAALVRSRT